MRNSTKRFVLVAAVSVLAGSGSVQVRGGGITYQLINDAVDQNGWTLSGSIMTDGTIGLLGTNDFTSWTWTITNPTGTFTHKSTDPGAAQAVEGNVVMATQSSLLLLGTGTGELEFVTHGNSVAEIIWVRNSDVYDDYNPISGQGNYPWATSPPHGYGSGTWTIATASVPEPSSIVLALLAGASGIAYGMALKLRGKRKGRAKGTERITGLQLNNSGSSGGSARGS